MATVALAQTYKTIAIAKARRRSMLMGLSLASGAMADAEIGSKTPADPILVHNPPILKAYGAMVDLKSLRYFVAVAETRSVGKAALRLHMAQPPLSVHIRNLEAQVGTALFRRHPSGMALTDAGNALYARAREALALAHDGVEAARSVASGKSGRLSVGYMFALGYAVLPKLVPQLRNLLPGVELQFVEMSAHTYEAQIVEHKVTIGLCMPPARRSELASVMVGSQALRLAMRRGAPLARLASVPLDRLQGQRQIALPSSQDGSETSFIPALLRRHQVTTQVVERVETVHAALALVLAGEGYAIVPECAAVGAPPGVVFRPFKNVQEAFEVAACWRRDLASSFIEPFVKAARAALR
jgi:DNA-binding transcriptional LysR family regulator